jgi:hypothetical protein
MVLLARVPPFPKTVLGLGAISAGLLAARLGHGVGIRALSGGFRTPQFNVLVPLRQRTPFASFFNLAQQQHTMPVALPQPPPNWTHSPERVLSLTKEAIAAYKSKLDKVGALSAEEANFTSVRPLYLVSIEHLHLISIPV